MKHRIACIVGTRPEAIKMAPVILTLRRAAWAETVVVATAQHRELLDSALGQFDIVPDIDLDLMTAGQTLSKLTARLLDGLDRVFEQLAPAVTIAQGDTTTTMSAALASFYGNIPFAHVEAGLRTGDLANPFPEEANRIIVGSLARWHFAPTETAKKNLLREGVREDHIEVTGNTVIDALLSINAQEVETMWSVPRRSVLITTHRRESFGAPLARICAAIARLAELYPDVDFRLPMHPNPNVRSVIQAALAGRKNVVLSEPLDYRSFVRAMAQSHLVLTDSGGVQEEAPALGKPVLILRDETERTESVDHGVAKLVGTGVEDIVSAVQLLLDDPTAWQAMSMGISPYGDGHASERIAESIRRYFEGTALPSLGRQS